jgi:hypothetical protein
MMYGSASVPWPTAKAEEQVVLALATMFTCVMEKVTIRDKMIREADFLWLTIGKA